MFWSARCKRSLSNLRAGSCRSDAITGKTEEGLASPWLESSPSFGMGDWGFFHSLSIPGCPTHCGQVRALPPPVPQWWGSLTGSIPVVSGTEMDILAVQAGLEVRLGEVWRQEGARETQSGDAMRGSTRRLEVFLAIRAMWTQLSSGTELVGTSKPFLLGKALPHASCQLIHHPQIAWGAGGGGIIPASHAVTMSPVSKGKGLHPGGRWAVPRGRQRPSQTWSRGFMSFLNKTVSSERCWGDFKVLWSMTILMGGYPPIMGGGSSACCCFSCFPRKNTMGSRARRIANRRAWCPTFVLHPLDVLLSELEKEQGPSIGGDGKGEALWRSSCKFIFSWNSVSNGWETMSWARFGIPEDTKELWPVLRHEARLSQAGRRGDVSAPKPKT